VKTMSNKKEVKKNSEPAGKDTAGGMDAYSDVDKQIITELQKKGILESIKSVFGDKATDFIRLHCYINQNGKLVIKSLNKQFRDYIIGIPVWDLSFGSMKYILINKYILVKIANFSVVYDAINSGNAKFTDYVIAKQKNGSFRLKNVNRSEMEFEIQ
jgi:hypothetical protein